MVGALKSMVGFVMVGYRKTLESGKCHLCFEELLSMGRYLSN